MARFAKLHAMRTCRKLYDIHVRTRIDSSELQLVLTCCLT